MYGKEILNIRTVQGKKATNDKKILVEGKPLSIRDLLTMVKLMAENEKAINGNKIARNNRFYFAEAMRDAIYSPMEIDDICKKYFIPDKDENTRIFWPDKR